jgi:hypothetical protein
MPVVIWMLVFIFHYAWLECNFRQRRSFAGLDSCGRNLHSYFFGFVDRESERIGRAFSPLHICGGLPGALPQAGIGRAFGPEETCAFAQRRGKGLCGHEMARASG